MASRYAEHGWGDDDAQRMIDVAETGKQIDLLREMRARMVAKVADPTVAARDMASLMARLLDVSKQIREAEARGDDEPDDDEVPGPEPWDPSQI